MRITSLRPSTRLTRVLPRRIVDGGTQHHQLSATINNLTREIACGGPAGATSFSSADGRRRHVGVIASEHRGHPEHGCSSAAGAGTGEALPCPSRPLPVMSPPPPLAIGPTVEHMGRHTVCIRTFLNYHVHTTRATSLKCKTGDHVVGNKSRPAEVQHIRKHRKLTCSHRIGASTPSAR